MPGVNFGGFSMVDGKPLANGIASNLDSKSMIDGLVAAKKIDITKIEDKVKLNNSKLGAYSEMEKQLVALKKFASALRNSPYLDNSISDIFKSREVFINSNTSVPGNNYVGINVIGGANIGNYTITVDNIASSKTGLSTTIASRDTAVTQGAGGTTAGLFKEGSFDINGTTFTVAAGDTLDTIVNKINAESETTGAKAEVLKVSDTDYRLVLKSAKTGALNAYTLTDTDNVFQYVPLTTTAAQNAEFTINGLSIIRQSNVVADVIEGVTFNLYVETPALTEIKVEVANNNKAICDTVKGFIGAYNDLKTFAAKQAEIDPTTQKLKEHAILGNDNTMESIISDIQYTLASSVKGLTGDCTKLSDMGITFDSYSGDSETPAVSSILNFLDNEFMGMLGEEFEEVRKVFEFDYVSSSPDFRISTRTRKIDVNEFNLDINTSRAIAEVAKITYEDNDGNTQIIYADFDPGAIGGTITGKAGTVLEGLKIVYVGSGVDIADFSLTQGLADAVFACIESCFESGGMLEVAKSALSSVNSESNTDIIKKNEELDEYKKKLIKDYSALEAAIAKFNNVLNFLDAQSRAMEANRR